MTRENDGRRTASLTPGSYTLIAASDELIVKVNSGDPPLFDQSSLPLIKAVEHAGIVPGVG